MLDPRRVLTFREVARVGSFSRAADALSLTQPAVSQQVAALERQIGEPLLDRGPGGLTLTRAGEVLLAHADVVADRLTLAAGQLEELVADARRHLRAGAFPSAVATIVPVALARLGADTKVELVEGTQQELAAWVAAGDLHVAVCFQDPAIPRREPEGTLRVDIEDEPFVARLAPGHRLARRKRIRLADLAEETWVAPSREGLIARACREAGFTPAIRYVSRDPLANQALVSNGLAVTISPARLSEATPGNATVEVEDAPTRRVFALLPATGATALAREFVEALT